MKHLRTLQTQATVAGISSLDATPPIIIFAREAARTSAYIISPFAAVITGLSQNVTHPSARDIITDRRVKAPMGAIRKKHIMICATTIRISFRVALPAAVARRWLMMWRGIKTHCPDLEADSQCAAGGVYTQVQKRSLKIRRQTDAGVIKQGNIETVVGVSIPLCGRGSNAKTE